MTIYETVSTLKDKSIEGLLNHFNWEVEKLPLVIAENQQATSAVATARRMDDGRIVVFSDKVDENYEVIQNMDLILHVVKPFIDSGCEIESAGTYDDGKRVWVKGKFNDPDFKLDLGGFGVTPHWIISNDHCARRAASVGIIAKRKICSNGLTITVKDLIRVNHTKGATQAMIDVADCMSKMNGEFRTYGEKLERMSRAPISQADFDQLIKRVHSPNWDRLQTLATAEHATKKEIETFEKEQDRMMTLATQINEIFHNNDTIKSDRLAKDTVYGAYQALNWFENHGGVASESRVHSLAFGAARTRDYNALQESLMLVR